MCLQCVVEANVYYWPNGRPFLGDYGLYRAKKDDSEWAKDEWALIYINNPVLYFEMSDELLKNAEQDEGWTQLYYNLEDGFLITPREGHRLIKEAKKHGYKEINSFTLWFHKYLLAFFKSNPQIVSHTEDPKMTFWVKIENIFRYFRKMKPALGRLQLLWTLIRHYWGKKQPSGNPLIGE